MICAISVAISLHSQPTGRLNLTRKRTRCLHVHLFSGGIVNHIKSFPSLAEHFERAQVSIYSQAVAEMGVSAAGPTAATVGHARGPNKATKLASSPCGVVQVSASSDRMSTYGNKVEPDL